AVGALHQQVQGDCVGLELRHDLRGTIRLITQHHLVAGSGKMRLDKLSRHGVILNHKNPRRLFRLCTGLADSGAGLSQSRGSRQGEKEATSLARLALEAELPAL